MELKINVLPILVNSNCYIVLSLTSIGRLDLIYKNNYKNLRRTECHFNDYSCTK